MPTEYKFDDLDLQEQPARGDTASGDYSFQTCQTCQTIGNCGNTAACTSFACCTDNC